MWLLPLSLITIGLLIYLTAATGYLVFLGVAYFLVREPEITKTARKNRFAILVPAHNEELLIARLCQSLLQIDYSSDNFDIFIVADNCLDGTVKNCEPYPVNVLVRQDARQVGKGFALSWGLEKIGLENFDAVVIVDADNVVDRFILNVLNDAMNRGEQAVQCCNSVGNRADSWFTQLLFVSRTIGNLLYHHSKYKMGLASTLMGNGMCFKAALLREKGWTAFSIGEDWEYYAQLVEDHIKIGFAVNAKVFHQESRSLDQATSQRLRWASGRFHVARKLGIRLFLKGLRKTDIFTLDASLPLIFPNYSLLFNLTVLTLILCFFLPTSVAKPFAVYLCLSLMGSQVLLFVTGAILCGGYWEIFKALFHAPVFLIWKMFIDILSFTKIYRTNRWIRTERHFPKQKHVAGKY